jgi:hypothetical protein
VGKFLTGCKPVSFSRRTLLHGVSKYYTKRAGSEKTSLLNVAVRQSIV